MIVIYGWIALVLYRLKKKIEKNKSEYEEPLSGAFDRARLIVYKSNIFPTVSCFVSEKNRILLKTAYFPRFLDTVIYIVLEIFSQNKMTNWVFIYCYYISIESFWKGESNEHMQNFIGTYTYLFKGIKVLMIPHAHSHPLIFNFSFDLESPQKKFFYQKISLSLVYRR